MLAVVLVSSLLQAVTATPAAALDTTTVFLDPFSGNTVATAGSLALPTASGGNDACLTAAGNSVLFPKSCTANTDTNGSGVLRLTAASGDQLGGSFATSSQPTTKLIDITFDSYQWGGNGADGMTLAVAATDPATSVAPSALGVGGGGLGYSTNGSAPGLVGAYLGVGFDVYGFFSQSGYQGSTCAIPAYVSTSSTVPGQVVVRGPGSGTTGYCAINSTATSTSSPAVALRSTTRAASRVPVQFVMNPGAVALTTTSGISVAAGSYLVAFTPVGGSRRTLTGTLPSASGILPASWLTSTGIPKQFTFGWTASTGGLNDYHEIGAARAETYSLATVLSVSTSSYSAATPPAGSPVTYTSVPTVSFGNAGPVTLTQTMPSGVLPLAGYGGTDWSCQAPAEQSITCVSTANTVAAGTALPAVTFSAVVTGAAMTSSIIQGSSSTTASATGLATAAATTMTAGTVPAAPTSVSISPTGGLYTGGTVAVLQATTSNVPPTIILVGTAAELAAGTAQFLLPCPAGRAAGCFNPEGTSNYIQSMPARASPEAVSVRVVTLGVGTVTSYSYNAAAPSAPTAPTAVAGVGSAVVSWTAPAANGSSITGYRVTPYIGSTAQTARVFDASATSQTLTGLTVGIPYTFTVAATNAIGTGTASAKSAAVTPFSLPGTPTAVTAVAGSLQATVSWSAPSSGGSPITGYTITPYIGATAQTPQVFSGTATSQVVTSLTAGTAYTFRVAATNAGGTGAASSGSAAVTPNAAPTLTFATPLAGGQVAVAYSATLTGSGGTAPLTWSITGGALPPGLNLAGSTGALIGTPTTAGSYGFTVRIVDSGGQSATRAATLVIAAAPTVTFTPTPGELTVAYSQQPTVAGGTGPFTWSITAGALPAGLSISSSTGLIGGTPTASGTFSITVAARDSLNRSGSATVSLVIAALPTLPFTAPTAGRVGVPYTTTLTAAGGVAPLVWSISAGSVPAGLTLNTGTGVLSGTPTAAGSSSFTVTVTDANGKTAAKAVTLVVTAGPLVITNTASVAATTAGATVSYTVVITNTGSTAFTGTTLTDGLAGTLDDAAYNANGSVSYTGGASGSLAYSAPSLTWTGNLPAGGAATITYSVTVNSPATGNRILTGTVTSDTLGTNCATGSADSRCTSTVTVSGLSITTSANSASTTPGSTVRISILVTNTGQTAYTAATVSNGLGGMLDDATYGGDATTTAGSVSYANSTITWTGNLAPGASATITYSVTVANPDLGDKFLSGTAVSTAAGSTCPSASPAASCTVTVPVLVPSMTMNNRVGAAPQLLGHWTFDEGSGTTAADTAGSHTATLSAGTGWTTARQQGAASLNLNGSALADTDATVIDTSASFTVSAWVKLNNLNGYQTVVSQDGNTVSGFYLGLRGDTGRFAFVRLNSDANQGAPPFPSAQAAPVVGQWYQLTGIFDASASTLSLYVNGQLQQTTAAPPGWSAGGNLIIGGAKYNAGRVDYVNGTIDDVQVYRGVLTGGSSTTPGSVVPLTTTIANTGQSPYTGVTASIALAGAVDDAVYNADATASSGNLSYNPTTMVLTWTGDLAIGAVVTVSSSMTVNNSITGDKSALIAATSGAAGSGCPTGTAASTCTAAATVLVPSLLLSKTANVSSATPGTVVQYTVTATNTGQAPYSAATFAESLAGILDDATYNANAAATSGTVGYSGSTLTWTGNLAVGATATITYSATVRSPDPGNLTLTGTVISTTPFSNCASGSVDARCSNTIGVLVPALSVVTTVDAASTTPGSTVKYTVTVTNTGPTTYTGATVALDFRGILDDSTYSSGSVSTGSLATTNQISNWSLTLAPGAAATGVFYYVVNSPAGGDRSMTTVVTSDASGSTCPPGSTVTPCTTSIPVLLPGLTITKSVSATTVATGGTVTYTITALNTGGTSYPAASFSDPLAAVLDDATYNSDVSATSGTATYASSTVSWSGALATGASATITYSVTVRDPDPGDKQLAGAVRSTTAGSNCAAGSTDVRCSTTVNVLVPGLTIIQTVGTPTTTPGAMVPYTITVTNSGQTAYTGAAFTLPLAGILDDATYNNNVSATAGTAGQANSVISWTGNLATGASATVTFSVTVKAADVGDDLLTGTASSTTAGTNCPPSAVDGRCSTTVPVARLTIAEQSPYTSTTPGAALALTATFSNTGQVPYTGISVSNSGGGLLDDVVASGDQTATSGTLSVTPTALTWTGSIPVGGTVTVVGNVTVLNPPTGDRNITTTWVSTTPGNNCQSGSADPRCSTSIPVLLPGLTISQAADTSSTTPGGTVGYTITVHNTGQTGYTGISVADSLVGIVDDADYNGDAQASAGSVAFSAATLTWTGSLAAGATATVTFSVTIRDPDTGDKSLNSVLQSSAAGNNCPASGTDSRCSTSVLVLTPLLTIVTSADRAAATLGSSVTFSITVTNAGQTNYPAADLSLPLAGVIDDATIDVQGSSIGLAVVTDGVLNWTGELDPGESTTITVIATVNNSITGDGFLNVTVTSGSVGNNCSIGSVDTRCGTSVSITNAQALTFTATANVPTTVAGGVVSYSVTVVNATTSPIASVNFTESLTGILDDATYNNDIAASAGTPSVSGETLTWNGTVPARGSVTVSFSVTVNAGLNGDEVLTAVVTSTSVPSGNNCPINSPDTRCATAVPVASLQLSQAYASSTVTPGSMARLTATFTNTGQVPYQGISVSSPTAATLDDATPNGDQTATSGTLVLTQAAIVWTGDIPVGTTVTVTGTLTVTDPSTGDREMTGTLVSDAPGNNCPPGGSDELCVSLTTVTVPSLTITTTPNVASAEPGESVGYQLTIDNTGPTAYEELSITESLAGVLDDATYNFDAISSDGGTDYSAPTLTWTGDLPAGALVTIIFSVTVNASDAGDKALRDVLVSAAAGSNCKASSGDPRCRSTVGVRTPGLTTATTVDQSTATLDSVRSYSIVVSNTGQTVYEAATFTENLSDVFDDAYYNNDVDASSGSVDDSTANLVWTGALNPGDSATITFSVTVNSSITGDGVLSDQVTSTTSGSNCADGSADARCGAVVTVVDAFGVTTTKTADVPSTTGGAVVRYTVTVANASGIVVTAVLTDPLTDILDDAVYGEDAVASTGDLTYNEPDLNWTGVVMPGETATITYTVIVNADVTGDQILSGTVVSAAPEDSNNCRPGSSDVRCVSIVPVARLMLTQGESVSATPGEEVSLSTTIENTGRVPYFGISVAFLVPGAADDILSGSQSASSGTLTVGEAGATWIGDIPVGESVTVSGTVVIRDPATGDRLVDITLESSAPGNNCLAGSEDPACSQRITVLVPELTVSTVANATAVATGGTVDYTITVKNTGETPYTGASVVDDLSGLLDDAVYNADAATTSGEVNYSSPALTWTGDLAMGETATITFSVTVNDPDLSDKTMISSVVSPEAGSSCPPASGNADCRSTVLVLTPGLTIVSTTDVGTTTLGATVSYTITVRNSGQTAYPVAPLNQSLANVFDDATYNADLAFTAGTAEINGYVLDWTGSLNPGQAASITFSVTVDNPAAGDLVLATTAISAITGSNCNLDSPDARCTSSVTVINATELVLELTADSASTVVGGEVTFTATVVNAGVSALIGVEVVLPLTEMADDFSDVRDEQASSGSVYADFTYVSWEGSLAPGATVTIAFTVVVADTVRGDGRLNGELVALYPFVSNCQNDGVDARCAVSVPIAGLHLVETASTVSATPGSVITITTTFTNTGQVPYQGISVASPRADTSDDTIPTGNQTVSSGILVRSASAVTWTGDIPVGSQVTTSRTLTVRNPPTGDRNITATLNSEAPGNNCADGTTDPDCTFAVAVLIPGLAVSVLADSPFVEPGGTAGYTITITNTGETDYAAALITTDLAGVLDDATYNADAEATTGATDYSGSVLNWTGDLAAGGAATITYTATARSPAAGDKTMVTSVTSAAEGSTCPTVGGGADCRNVVPVLTPALTITAAADVTTSLPGATVNYTVTASNTGQTNYVAAGFTFSSDGMLDDGIVNGDAEASVGTVTTVGSQWTWAGDLDVGEEVTVTFSVTVDDPDTGDHLLQQTVTSQVPGNNCPASGTDPRCSTSVAVAELTIVASADVSTAKPTDVIRFSGTYTNTGQVPYLGITIVTDVTDAVDDVSYNGDATVTAGNVSIVPGAPEISWTGDLAVGQTVQFNGSATVNNPDAGNKAITLSSSTTAPASNCPVAGDDPRCVVTITGLTPSLTITKTANASTTTPGSTVGYVITITNSGDTAYQDAIVTDSLANLLDRADYLADVDSTSGTVDLVDDTIVWTGDLLIDQTAVVTFSMQVHEPFVGDQELINIVVSDELGSTCADGSTSIGCTATVAVLLPRLEIGISADSTSSTPGSIVRYVVTIANVGETPYQETTVTAALAGALDDATYNADADADTGDVAFTSPALTWTGDLALGQSVTLTYSLTITDPDTGDRSLVTEITSPAAGSACTVAEPCGNEVQVLLPELTVSTEADAATATPGDVVNFTITIANTGQTVYTATTLTTVLTGVTDDATITGSAVASGGVVDYIASTLSWTGSLDVGEQVTVRYAATVAEPDTGDRSLTSTVVAPAAGSTCQLGSSEPSCTVTVQVLIPQLSISKTADTASTVPGGTVTYTIAIENSGQTAYVAAEVTDSLAGVLTDAGYNGDAEADGGTVGYSDAVVTWTGDLDVGQSASVSYSVTVNDPDDGDKSMVNTVVSTVPGSSCPPGATDSACTATVQVLIPALTITQAADTSTVTAGGVVDYTITVHNTGQTAYVAATVTDDLGGVLDDAAYNDDVEATTGTVDDATSVLTWTGDLQIGESAVITFSVTTDFPATGDRELTNTVVSADAGSNCVQASPEPDCSTAVAVLVPELTVAKSVDTTEVVIGGTALYTITISNTGEADYPSASVADPLAGVLDDATYNDDATATSGDLGYADGTLSWNGALGIGQTVVIGYSATAVGGGDMLLTNSVVSSTTGSTCAAEQSVDPPCATATVVNNRSIELRDLSESFVLAGPADATVTNNGAISMTIDSNSPGGYIVTVQGESSQLTNPSSIATPAIPLGELMFRESGTSDFASLTTDPQVVHDRDAATAPDGDAVSSDYQMHLPFVDPGTYTVTLEYIVSAQ